MITSLKGQCTLSGPDFNPDLLNALPNGLNTVLKICVGDLVKAGRYKGQLSQEGILILDGELDSILSIVEYVSSSPNYKQMLDKDYDLSILVAYKKQCNFELSAEQLTRMAQLNVTWSISCYEEE